MKKKGKKKAEQNSEAAKMNKLSTILSTLSDKDPLNLDDLGPETNDPFISPRLNRSFKPKM
jgi:hypothetical protein